MTEITVRYFGPLREIAKKKSEKIKISESATLIELLSLIERANGQKLRNFVHGPNNKVREGIMFAIDGDSIETTELATIKCGRVKEFVIIPPISGGIR